jgi:hypothetical protein
MSQPFTEEFLNDFIDGQLSGEELLRAERLLLENAAFREQVETYRAIGRQIKSLPRKSLPADFSQTVVRNLELAPSLSNRAATEIIPSRSNQFWRNGLIAGALAASFLLGVFLIQNQPNVAPDLATAPKSAARHELDSSVEKPVPGAALELQVHDQPNDNETVADYKKSGNEGEAQPVPMLANRGGFQGVDPKRLADSSSNRSADRRPPAIEAMEEASKKEALPESLGVDPSIPLSVGEESSSAPDVMITEAGPSDTDHWLVEIPESPTEREKVLQTLGKLGLSSPKENQDSDSAAGSNFADIFEISGTAEAVEDFRQQLAQSQTVKLLSQAESLDLNKNAEAVKDQAPNFGDPSIQRSANYADGNPSEGLDKAMEPAAKDKILTVGPEGGRGITSSLDVRFIRRQLATDDRLRSVEKFEMKETPQTPKIGVSGAGGSADAAPSNSSLAEDFRARQQTMKKRDEMTSQEAPSPGLGGGGKGEPAAALKPGKKAADEAENQPAEIRRVRIVIQSKSKTPSADPAILPAEKK